MSALSRSCPARGTGCKPLQTQRPSCRSTRPRCCSSWTLVASSTAKRKSQRRAQSARKASKPKSSDHSGDGHGSDDRANSNAQAGTSGIDRQPSRKTSKSPNKQVLCLQVPLQGLTPLTAMWRSVYSLPVHAAEILCLDCSTVVDFTESICFIESRDSVKVRNAQCHTYLQIQVAFASLL